MPDEEFVDDYLELKDLRVTLSRGEEESTRGFCLCLWIYLSSSFRSPTVILRQIHADTKDEVPFLVLDKENKMTLFPLMNIHKESSSPGSSCSLNDISCTPANIECPLEKWFHVGCEVATNYTRLHIDRVVVEEKPLISEYGTNVTNQNTSERITISGNDELGGKLQVYTHGVQILSSSSSIQDHFAKTPPIQLSLDGSCISDGFEESGDGIWSIVGGKASCRRNFSLEVVLLDALERHVHNDMEVFASLVYADNGHAVEKQKNFPEAPLLASYDGLEFPSTDRPVKLTNGRASFKLKISQLSSKCDNRLFRVHLHSSNSQRYPFLEAYSPVIRCISRSRNSRTSHGLGRKLSSLILLHDDTVSPGGNERSPETQDNYGDGQFQISNLTEVKYIPPSKRPKGLDKLQKQIGATEISQQKKHGCNSIALTDDDDETSIRRCLEPKFENLIRTDNEPSDSESTDAVNSGIKGTDDSRTSISDATLFKYCIEGTDERSMLLKGIITYSSDQDIADFAELVSLYTGCSHHRYQVLIARQLIQEVDDSWNLISRGNHRVLWRDAVSLIQNNFRKITCSDTRCLSGQDVEVLRRIAGCGDDITREGFDKIWYWLYPVAYTLSKQPLKEMWECMSPRWFEGLITKEEAEGSLRGPIGLQKPGTYVLRFPTSRSWPHPDAGSLVITYLGLDGILHNKLLSLDNREGNRRPVQYLLLEEPGLTQLGRVTRTITPFDSDEV